MGFPEDVRQGLKSMYGRGHRYPNRKRMADDLGFDPTQLNRFLKSERGLNIESLGQLLDGVGARIVFPDQETESAREVCFVAPEKLGVERGESGLAGPAPEDYLAVPLAASPVAAGPGLISEDKIEGWVLVWRHHESVRFRSNMVAVQIGMNEHSMVPALHPGDIVLVDRSDRDPSPAGKIMLVTEPGDGAAMVKRVAANKLDNDLELVFYSDNSKEFPPMTYRLDRDYDGDIGRAIAGKVVWAWSDMTKK